MQNVSNFLALIPVKRWRKNKIPMVQRPNKDLHFFDTHLFTRIRRRKLKRCHDSYSLNRKPGLVSNIPDKQLKASKQDFQNKNHLKCNHYGKPSHTKRHGKKLHGCEIGAREVKE